MIAIQLIKNKHNICFDISSENGQIFENVAHMDWFEDAIAERIQNDYPNADLTDLMAIYSVL